jgi:hypothetical protein
MHVHAVYSSTLQCLVVFLFLIGTFFQWNKKTKQDQQQKAFLYVTTKISASSVIRKKGKRNTRIFLFGFRYRALLFYISLSHLKFFSHVLPLFLQRSKNQKGCDICVIHCCLCCGTVSFLLLAVVLHSATAKYIGERSYSL